MEESAVAALGRSRVALARVEGAPGGDRPPPRGTKPLAANIELADVSRGPPRYGPIVKSPSLLSWKTLFVLLITAIR